MDPLGGVSRLDAFYMAYTFTAQGLIEDCQNFVACCVVKSSVDMKSLDDDSLRIIVNDSFASLSNSQKAELLQQVQIALLPAPPTDKQVAGTKALAQFWEAAIKAPVINPPVVKPDQAVIPGQHANPRMDVGTTSYVSTWNFADPHPPVATANDFITKMQESFINAGGPPIFNVIGAVIANNNVQITMTAPANSAETHLKGQQVITKLQLAVTNYNGRISDADAGKKAAKTDRTYQPPNANAGQVWELICSISQTGST